MPYFRVFKSFANVSTYVTRNEDRVTCVLLFERHHGRVQVLNEGIGIDQQTIDQFAQRIFHKFPDVDLICFNQIETLVTDLSFPFQIHEVTENYIVPLPPTPMAYTSALGNATRRNIKRYMRKLLEDQPSFICRFFSGEQIERQHFATLLQMSEAKVLQKKGRFSIDPAYAEGLWKLARQSGFVSVAMVDGKVCAGLICFQVQSYYFAHVVAHDSAYDGYGLGILCCYLTMCEAIRRGGTVFNMGQLHYHYKVRLLASRHHLDRIVIYRSYQSGIGHAGCVLKMLAGKRIRNLKSWLLQHPDSMMARSAKYLLYRAHQLRSRG